MGISQLGLLTEGREQQNISYLLAEESAFLSTGYKVLQNQKNNGFIRCLKLRYNGKIKLIYLTEGYKSLTSLLPQISADQFIIIIANLLQRIGEIRHNGFLSVTNINAVFDRIFVDVSTFTVHLIYIPITSDYSDPEGFAALENELRTNLIRAISQHANLVSPPVLRINAVLQDGMKDFDALYGFVAREAQGFRGGAGTGGGGGGGGSRGGQSQPTLTLRSLNLPEQTAFSVSKQEYLIGKKADSVDGVIANNTVSRVHCKIEFSNSVYYVTDLGSANGTFVNGRTLTKGQRCSIKNGDRLLIATVEFAVKI